MCNFQFSYILFVRLSLVTVLQNFLYDFSMPFLLTFGYITLLKKWLSFLEMVCFVLLYYFEHFSFLF